MHSDKVSTTASESRDRKKTKPIMEKRRRARINASLAELKSLLLEAIKKEGARHSKMEKADILEMTVKYLRDMQRQSFTGGAANSSPNNKHRSGYSECRQEVGRFLSNIEGCDVELKTRLLDHLANFVSRKEETRSPSPPVTAAVPVTQDSLPAKSVIQPSLSQPSDQPQTTKTSPSLPLSVDINNNIPAVSSVQQVQPAKVVSGLQVIPTKLQTGEIAFVLPGNVIGTNPTTNYILPVYTSPNTSPAKPTVTMTTAGLTSPGSFMTIIPSTDVIQTCTLAPLSGNISIVPQAVSATSNSVSPSSTPDSSVLSVSPSLLHHGNDVRVKSEIRYFDVRTSSEVRHQDGKPFNEVLHHDGMDLREVRHDDVKNLSKHSCWTARELGGVRHLDVRDVNELHQERISDTHMWRPW